MGRLPSPDLKKNMSATALIDMSGLTGQGLELLDSLAHTHDATVVAVSAQFNGSSWPRFEAFCKGTLRKLKTGELDNFDFQGEPADILTKIRAFRTNPISCEANAILTRWEQYATKCFSVDHRVGGYMAPTTYLDIATQDDLHWSIKAFFPYQPSGVPDTTQLVDLLQYANTVLIMSNWRSSGSPDQVLVNKLLTGLFDTLCEVYDFDSETHGFKAVATSIYTDLQELPEQSTDIPSRQLFGTVKEDMSRFAPRLWTIASDFARAAAGNPTPYTRLTDVFCDKIGYDMPISEICNIDNPESPFGKMLETLKGASLNGYKAHLTTPRPFDDRRTRFLVIDLMQFLTRPFMPHGCLVDNQVSFYIAARLFLDNNFDGLTEAEPVDLGELVHEVTEKIRNTGVGLESIFENHKLVVLGDAEADDWRSVDAFTQLARNHRENLEVVMQVSGKVWDAYEELVEGETNELNEFYGPLEAYQDITYVHNPELHNSTQQADAAREWSK